MAMLEPIPDILPHRNTNVCAFAYSPVEVGILPFGRPRLGWLSQPAKGDRD